MLRRLADALLRGLARLATDVFFRRVDVVGSRNLPNGGSTLYFGNHYNGLIDPALAFGWLPPPIRLLAKSTLWSHVPAGLFVRLAGAVPVYRQIDADADTSRNVEMFERCFELLAAGGSIALFPEGISHNEPSLQQVKTGAARICLGTLRRQPGTPLTVIPFGLVFEDRERFRSSALMEIGQPIDPAPFLTDGGEDDRAAVRALTEAIEQGLTAVTLNYASWREAELLRRAADVYFRDQGGEPASGRDTDPAAALPYRRAFAEGYPEMARREPERTAAAVRTARSYFDLLDLAGIDDRQVTLRYTAGGVTRFLARTALDLFVLLPIGLVGAVVHWLPYRVPGWIADALPIEGDQRATYKLMISLFLFPTLWGALSVLVAGRWGSVAGLAAAVLLPLSGWVALRLKERFERLVAESRAFLVLEGRRSPAAALRRRRRRLLDALADLVERYDST